MEHARPPNATDAYELARNHFHYPITLAHVCSKWRKVILDTPMLWTNIHIFKSYKREVANAHLRYSEGCLLSITWFSFSVNPSRDPQVQQDPKVQDDPEVHEVVQNLIIPSATRLEKFTFITWDPEGAGALLAGMELIKFFPILWSVEFSGIPQRTPITQPLKRTPTSCLNAPLLRRYKLIGAPFLPLALPSNLVILSLVRSLNLDPLLEFLPEVAHSLQHLEFNPSTSEVLVKTPKPKTLLQNLKTLLVSGSYAIMNYINAPNLIYFSASHPLRDQDPQKVSEMFNGFSAPELQSILFYRIPLLPLLTSYEIPRMFPKLESVVFIECINESNLLHLLEPPYLPQGNSLPNLKELTISQMENWSSLLDAIERRRENGNWSLRKIRLPGKVIRGETLATRFPGIDFVELTKLAKYDPLAEFTPPEPLESSFNQDHRLFLKIRKKVERWLESDEDAAMDDEDDETDDEDDETSDDEDDEMDVD